MNKRTLFVGMCLFLAACNTKTEKNVTGPDFLAGNIDTTVSPSDDFFEYAEGTWLKNTEIPAGESSWGIGDLVQEEIYNRLRKINEAAVNKKDTKGVEQQTGDFWYSGMDTLNIEKQGLKPLQPDFSAIAKIMSVHDLVVVAADFHTKGINVLFNDYVSQDDKNSEVYAFQMSQGGLGMPNRDYYFNTDERTEGVRKAYKLYMIRTFMQLGNDSATSIKNANAIIALEKRLAGSSRKLADLRDPYKNYNKMNVIALAHLVPQIDWGLYLKGINAPKLDSVIVGQPEFYTTLNNELQATSLEDWKNYLRFRLVQRSAPYLDNATYQNLFDYYKTLTGASEPRARWKRVIDAEEDALGEALGQMFVKEYFNKDAKKRYTDLVENIRDAYKDRIKN